MGIRKKMRGSIVCGKRNRIKLSYSYLPSVSRAKYPHLYIHDKVYGGVCVGEEAWGSERKGRGR